jgi:hypothetical protein
VLLAGGAAGRTLGRSGVGDALTHRVTEPRAPVGDDDLVGAERGGQDRRRFVRLSGVDGLHLVVSLAQ